MWIIDGNARAAISVNAIGKWGMENVQEGTQSRSQSPKRASIEYKWLRSIASEKLEKRFPSTSAAACLHSLSSDSTLCVCLSGCCGNKNFPFHCFNIFIPPLMESFGGQLNIFKRRLSSHFTMILRSIVNYPHCKLFNSKICFSRKNVIYGLSSFESFFSHFPFLKTITKPTKSMISFSFCAGSLSARLVVAAINLCSWKILCTIIETRAKMETKT